MSDVDESVFFPIQIFPQQLGKVELFFPNMALIMLLVFNYYNSTFILLSCFIDINF